MQAHEMHYLNDNAQYPLDKHPLYSRDADRPTSMTSSACSTPRSLNSYSSSATDVSPGRLLIPRDIQSPSQVVAQIRGAHKQLLYLSRNNFAQPAADATPDQHPPSQPQDWQQIMDQQHDDCGLDRISEASGSSYTHDRLQADTPHTSASMHSRAQDLQHTNETLYRQLHALQSDMEQQQHKHFEMRQEQHLQLEDLRAHVSHLEHQLQDNQDSTAELLSVNSFLDTQLNKHKDQLHAARQSTLRYHRQLQQEQQEQCQLKKQLQDTQSQLADAWQEGNQQQQKVADLQRQLKSATEQERLAEQLSDAQTQLASAREELASCRRDLAAADHDKQQLGQARDRLTADLKEVNMQLMGLQSALTEAFKEQDVAVQQAEGRVQAQRAQQAQAAAKKLSAVTHRSQQLEARVADLQQQLQQAQSSTENTAADTHNPTAQEHQELATQVSSLQQQLQQVQTLAEKAALEQQQAAAQEHQQLATQISTLQQQLQQAQASTENAASDKLNAAAQHQEQLEAEVTDLKQQLQQAQASSTATLSEAAQHSQQLEAQVQTLEQQLHAVQASATAQSSDSAQHHEKLGTQLLETQKQLQQAQSSAKADTLTATEQQQQLEAQVEDLEKQLQQVKASSQAEMSTTAQHIAKLEAQLLELQQQLQQAQSSATANSSTATEQKQQHKAEIMSLQKQVQQAGASAEQAASESASQQSAAEQQVAEHQAQAANLQKQLDQAQASSAEELSAAMHHSQQVDAQLSSLQQQHRQTEASTADDTARLEQLRQRNTEVETQLAELHLQLEHAQQRQFTEEQQQLSQSHQLKQLNAEVADQLQEQSPQLEQRQQKQSESDAEQLAQLTQLHTELQSEVQQLQEQLQQAQQEVQIGVHDLDNLAVTNRQYVEHAGSLQGQLADLQRVHAAQADEIAILKAETQQLKDAELQKSPDADIQQQTQSLKAASDQQAEQAVAHAKEVIQLTEAHAELQNLVNTLTEENVRLDQDNTDRSMHIGSLAAGLDQVKRAHSGKLSPDATSVPEAQGDKDVQPASHSVSTTPATADMSSQTADARQGQAGTSHNDQDRVIQHLHSEIDTLKKKVTSLQSQLQQQLAEHLAAATQSSEADVQAAQQALHAQHAEQMAELKTEFECLLEDYTAKDQQVQELMTKAEAPVQSADSHQSKQSQGAAAESEKLTHLTDVNRQLEDHVTSLDSQLEQLQQELEAAGTEATAASASAQEALENALSAQRAQHETSLVQSKATVELVQEDCNAKALQVHQLLTEVDQLTDEREQRLSQIQRLQAKLDYVSNQTASRVQQMEEQLEALQQEHHRLNEAHRDLEKQNKLLQEECNQLQGYISVLDEDLGKAQEHIGSVLADDHDSAVKQNEMLTAAAKQLRSLSSHSSSSSQVKKHRRQPSKTMESMVCQIQATNAKRSKMPKLLRKFSSRKKDRASFALEEPVTPKSPAVHQMSPRASALPPFHAAHRQSQRHPPPDTNAYPLSSHLGGDAAHFVHTASGQLSIDVLQPSLSDVSAEASVEVQKLKDENLKLADKLSRAENAMAELNCRLLDAAFGADTVSKSGSRSVRRTISGLDHTDTSSVAERESNMAPSNSSDYVSLAGMPPGVPLDPIYD